VVSPSSAGRPSGSRSSMDEGLAVENASPHHRRWHCATMRTTRAPRGRAACPRGYAPTSRREGRSRPRGRGEGSDASTALRVRTTAGETTDVGAPARGGRGAVVEAHADTRSEPAASGNSSDRMNLRVPRLPVSAVPPPEITPARRRPRRTRPRSAPRSPRAWSSV
jgi:hypothetical protein